MEAKVAIPARLARILHQELGDEGGDDLVNWMSQMDANRSEWRAFMEAWSVKIDARFAESEARIDTRFAEHRELFAQQRELTVASFAGLEQRVDARITDLYKWAFVFWCGGTLALILTVVLK